MCQCCHVNIIWEAPAARFDPGVDNYVKMIWHCDDVPGKNVTRVTPACAACHNCHMSHELSSHTDPGNVCLAPSSYLLPTYRPRPRWGPCCGSGRACCCCSPGPRPPPAYHRRGGARCSTDPRPSERRNHRQSASSRKPRTRSTAGWQTISFQVDKYFFINRRKIKL